jgi:hypothetical protein
LAKNVLPKLINEDQAGYVFDRFIGEVVVCVPGLEVAVCAPGLEVVVCAPGFEVVVGGNSCIHRSSNIIFTTTTCNIRAHTTTCNIRAHTTTPVLAHWLKMFFQN